jgi:bisphosphoglycerate-independent phosphoglycerate mutase (AlkP superfamily)
LRCSGVVVIDGWGIPSETSPKDGDAIAAAKTPVMDAFQKNADGYTELEASSLAVGLPEGLMGNSEVGHLNIGAGRVVWQDVVRIDQTIKKGELIKNDVVMDTFKKAKEGTGRLHLAGLISDGGVVCSFARKRNGREGLLTRSLALQARSPLRSPESCEGLGGSPCLHPLLR